MISSGLYVSITGSKRVTLAEVYLATNIANYEAAFFSFFFLLQPYFEIVSHLHVLKSKMNFGRLTVQNTASHIEYFLFQNRQYG